MSYSPIPPVSFPSTGNSGTIDINQFSRTGSLYTSTDQFKLMMAQNFSSSFDILLGTEEKAQDSIFGTGNIGGTSSSSLFSGLSSALPSDIAGQNMLTNSITPQVQLVALSYLPGKTVTAFNPLTSETITGKVNNVSIDNGILLIDIAGTKVPPEYLTTVAE